MEKVSVNHEVSVTCCSWHIYRANFPLSSLHFVPSPQRQGESLVAIHLMTIRTYAPSWVGITHSPQWQFWMWIFVQIQWVYGLIHLNNAWGKFLGTIRTIEDKRASQSVMKMILFNSYGWRPRWNKLWNSKREWTFAI